MQPLLIALQFLTSLPVRLPGMPAPEQMGRSLLYFPLVGVLLGSLLWLASLALAGAPLLLQAALLLTLWIGLSGFLHLDGLADSADAWLGGFGERERTLEIMKDPRSGPVAIVVLLLVLLLKFAALAALLEQGAGLALVLVLLLGRSSLLALFLTTPYVRRGGLGEAMAEHLPRRAACVVLALVGVVVLLAGFWLALLVALLVFAGLRRQLLQRLGGTTGDTAGALLELLEVLVLVVVAL
ncbi:adenosylcobinamide-GDP ribazoletransferase [Pseudomonas sp. ABC1]|uniref:adenosylcobinamide-GDP ribazoletransferase n=1 Tax=Pseudomonas sp. ABC1 TaxID=2748080 RepID=UPI0015C2F93C|nr:adenosylcobinamide-GDP ribazoletransferase [Pseudomonas sp. ABC1]QLF92710.1 adenosylcobinamide-GDP ribazoletransferase [Pseudomonas sp. ABC1]